MKFYQQVSIRITAVLFLVITFLGFAGMAQGAAPYNAEKERAFFKGKVVIIIVPSKAGGWFDTWARLIQPFLRDRLNATVVVDNDPAAGRKRAMNRVMAGTPDGTLISIVNRANMITEMIGEEGVRYKMGEFTWLGNTTNMARFLFVSQKNPFKSFQDFIKSTKKLSLGSTGVGAVNWYDAIIVKKVFQKDNLVIVPGYEGSADVYRAIIQGEVDGTVAVENEVTNLPAEEIRILLQMGGPKGYLPNIKVPTFAEVAPPDAMDYVKLLDEQFYMARFWAAPPKMDPNRAKLLRDTFEEICKDPKFIASVNKAGARVDFTRGERIGELVKSHMNQPARIIELFKETEAM